MSAWRPAILARMPIYEFQCKRCGKDSELLVPSANWEGTCCPACGSTRLVKKLSVFAVAGSPEDTPAAPACSGDPAECARCCHMN